MRYAIIGAGIAGLTAAFTIHQHNPEAAIEIFEAEDCIGGKLRSVPFSQGAIDVGAEAFLARRPEVIDLAEKLGLSDRIVVPSGASSLLYSGGELHSLPANTLMGIPAISKPVAHLVSPETAQRIDAEANADGIDWQVGEDRSIGELVRQRYGDEVTDRILSALLGGVYSCAADDLGLRATVPELAAALDDQAAAGEPVSLSRAVASVLDAREPGQGAPFRAFRGGYHELYEALAEQCGADIYIDAFISGVSRNTEGFSLKGAGEGTYDRLVLATPAPTSAMLASGLGEEGKQLSTALKSIKLASSAVVALRLESDAGLPENSGVLIAADEPEMSAKAFTFSSRKWPHLDAHQGTVLRASFGRFGDDALVRADEDDLVDLALDDLQRVTGFDARAAGVAEIHLQRWFGGIPRYDAGHGEAVAEIHQVLAQIPGLEATGAWSNGVGVPTVVADATAAATRLLEGN